MVRRLAMSVVAVAAASLVWSPQAAAEPTTYLIGNCWDPSQGVEERPATVVYNCDDTGILKDVVWTSWGADGAEGTGVDHSIECKPNCAQGPLLVNPIVVHAWNPKHAAAQGCPDGTQFYSDVTVTYPEGVPPWIQPGTTWSPGTDFVTVDGLPGVHFSDVRPYSCTSLAS